MWHSYNERLDKLMAEQDFAIKTEDFQLASEIEFQIEKLYEDGGF